VQKPEKHVAEWQRAEWQRPEQPEKYVKKYV